MKHEDLYRKPKLDHKLHTSINQLNSLRKYGESAFGRTPRYIRRHWYSRIWAKLQPKLCRRRFWYLDRLQRSERSLLLHRRGDENCDTTAEDKTSYKALDDAWDGLTDTSALCMTM